MLQEFKSFLLRGNVLDLAVAVIIGAAFGKIVTSLVNDILMPPIGLLIGGVDFSNLFVNLSDTPYSSLAAAQEAGAPTINYGLFLNNLIDFMLIAAAIFLVVRLANRLMAQLQAAKEVAPPVDAPPQLSTEEQLLTEIRDLLKGQGKAAL